VLAQFARATCIAGLVDAQDISLHSAASNTAETLYLALTRWLHIHRQVVDEIRDSPEFVTSLEFKQQEQRLLKKYSLTEQHKKSV
jgi:hypothetical protein